MIIAIDILKFIILVLVTFFMCQVISNNKKRISYIGTMLICFSTAVVEYINSGLVEALIFGELFIIGVDKLLKNEKFESLWSIVIPISILGFLLLSNISFEIPVGIAILTIFVWRILKYKFIENSQNNKNINKKALIIAVFGTLLAIIIFCFFYRYSKIEAFENKSGASYLMNYTYSVMTPFNKSIKFEDSRALATMISIFPIGLIIAIYYIFKVEDKHGEFLIPTIIVSILELIVLLSNKLNWFIPNYIIALGFAILQIYMIVYIFANIEERLFSLTKSAYISLLGIILILLMPFPTEFSNVRSRTLPYIMFIIESYLLLNYTDKRFWRLTSWLMTIICLFESIGYLVVNVIF
jgi:hypothetical protein